MTDDMGLGDPYNATLHRIKGQGGEKARLGVAALMWISHSERPLKIHELCHALAVKIGSPSLDADNIPSIGTLLACCQGLVTGFNCPVNPFYGSRVPLGPSRAFLLSPHHNGRNLLKLSEFSAG